MVSCPALLVAAPASGHGKTTVVAALCIGKVPAFYPRPMFEDAGWGQRLPINEVLFENAWKVGAGGTAPRY